MSPNAFVMYPNVDRVLPSRRSRPWNHDVGATSCERAATGGRPATNRPRRRGTVMTGETRTRDERRPARPGCHRHRRRHPRRRHHRQRGARAHHRADRRAQRDGERHRRALRRRRPTGGRRCRRGASGRCALRHQGPRRHGGRHARHERLALVGRRRGPRGLAARHPLPTGRVGDCRHLEHPGAGASPDHRAGPVRAPAGTPGSSRTRPVARRVAPVRRSPPGSFRPGTATTVAVPSGSRRRRAAWSV